MLAIKLNQSPENIPNNARMYNMSILATIQLFSKQTLLIPFQKTCTCLGILNDGLLLELPK